MSAAAAPLAMKALTGVVAGKVVGKVTGNEKLGMIAGLATGFMNPMGFGATAGTGVGATTATASMGGETIANATNAAIPSAVSPTMGNAVLDKMGMATAGAVPSAGGMFSTPAAKSIMAGNVLATGAAGYESRQQLEAAAKQGKLNRAQEIELQRMQNEEAAKDYERTHQNLPGGYSVGGKASPSMAKAGIPAPSADTLPARPMSAPEQYFQKYNDMYSGRVR